MPPERSCTSRSASSTTSARAEAGLPHRVGQPPPRAGARTERARPRVDATCGRSPSSPAADRRTAPQILDRRRAPRPGRDRGVARRRPAAGARRLLLFLGLGMLIGSDGLDLIDFGTTQGDFELARSVGIVALALILFEGGLAAAGARSGVVREPRPSVVGTLSHRASSPRRRSADSISSDYARACCSRSIVARADSARSSPCCRVEPQRSAGGPIRARPARDRLPRDQILLVAFGFKYDTAPAQRLGLRTAWVNRKQGRRPGPERPDHERIDLWPLAGLGA